MLFWRQEAQWSRSWVLTEFGSEMQTKYLRIDFGLPKKSDLNRILPCSLPTTRMLTIQPRLDGFCQLLQWWDALLNVLVSSFFKSWFAKLGYFFTPFSIFQVSDFLQICFLCLLIPVLFLHIATCIAREARARCFIANVSIERTTRNRSTNAERFRLSITHRIREETLKRATLVEMFTQRWCFSMSYCEFFWFRCFN